MKRALPEMTNLGAQVSKLDTSIIPPLRAGTWNFLTKLLQDGRTASAPLRRHVLVLELRYDDPERGDLSARPVVQRRPLEASAGRPFENRAPHGVRWQAPVSPPAGTHPSGFNRHLTVWITYDDPSTSYALYDFGNGFVVWFRETVPPDLQAYLLRLVNGIRSALCLLLLLVSSLRSRCPGARSFVLVLLASSRCFGGRADAYHHRFPTHPPDQSCVGSAADS